MLRLNAKQFDRIDTRFRDAHARRVGRLSPEALVARKRFDRAQRADAITKVLLDKGGFATKNLPPTLLKAGVEKSLHQPTMGGIEEIGAQGMISYMGLVDRVASRGPWPAAPEGFEEALASQTGGPPPAPDNGFVDQLIQRVGGRFMGPDGRPDVHAILQQGIGGALTGAITGEGGSVAGDVLGALMPKDPIVNTVFDGFSDLLSGDLRCFPGEHADIAEQIAKQLDLTKLQEALQTVPPDPFTTMGAFNGALSNPLTAGAFQMMGLGDELAEVQSGLVAGQQILGGLDGLRDIGAFASTFDQVGGTLYNPLIDGALGALGMDKEIKQLQQGRKIFDSLRGQIMLGKSPADLLKAPFLESVFSLFGMDEQLRTLAQVRQYTAQVMQALDAMGALNAIHPAPAPGAPSVITCAAAPAPPADGAGNAGSSRAKDGGSGSGTGDGGSASGDDSSNVADPADATGPEGVEQEEPDESEGSDGAPAFGADGAKESSENQDTFADEFKNKTGMTIEESIEKYKDRTGKDIDRNTIERLFDNSEHAREILLDNPDIHYHYRDILNQNVPKTLREAVDKYGWKPQPQARNAFHQPFPGAGILNVLDEQFEDIIEVPYEFISGRQLEIFQNYSNVKVLSPDGHREVVYGPDGQIINDPELMGTFNFHTNDEDHKRSDVAPYLIYGNMPEPGAPDGVTITPLGEQVLQLREYLWSNGGAESADSGQQETAVNSIGSPSVYAAGAMSTTAVRGSTAATLTTGARAAGALARAAPPMVGASAADGPLPVGEVLAVGIGLYFLYDEFFRSGAEQAIGPTQDPPNGPTQDPDSEPRKDKDRDEDPGIFPPRPYNPVSAPTTPRPTETEKPDETDVPVAPGPSPQTSDDEQGGGNGEEDGEKKPGRFDDLEFP